MGTLIRVLRELPIPTCLPHALMDAVFQFIDSMLARAMCATVKLPITNFHAMPNDLTSTMCTFGGERMDGAFETIEHMPLSAKHHLKRLVIFISTDFALSHCSSFLI